LELATDAINLELEAVALLGEKTNPRVPYGTIFRNTALSYHARFKITCGKEDSGKGISFFQKALEYAPTKSPNYCWFSNDLGQLYVTRYMTWNRESDAEDAAAQFGNVLQAEEKNLEAMSHCANLLQMRATNATDLGAAREYLGEAWDLLQKCIERMPPSYEDRGRLFDRCSAVCQGKYKTDGDVKDLDDAVEFSRKATAFPEQPDSWNYFRNLSEVLCLRYQHGRKPVDLDDALSAIKSAVTEAERSLVNQRLCLWGLGKVLRTIYDEKRDRDVLEHAIEKFAAAESLMDEGKESRALIRIDLGNAYCEKFKHTRLRPDLDAGVTCFKNALEDIHRTYPTGTQSDKLMVYSTLGAALLGRYTYWNSVDDLDSATEYIRQSLHELNESHPRFAVRASNLSHALQLKFELEKGKKDGMNLLREAQELVRGVLEGPIKLSSRSLNVLETHMGNIYYRCGGLDNLDLAIEHYRIALEAKDVEAFRLAITSLDMATTLKVKARATK